jgi:RNA polymerase sigma-70 factor (ECF subfamily)
MNRGNQTKDEVLRRIPVNKSNQIGLGTHRKMLASSPKAHPITTDSVSPRVERDSPTPERSKAQTDWKLLVARIAAGEDSAMEELYKLFSRGIRYYLCRQLGPQDLEDKVHDTFLIVVKAIRRGDVREPERLMGFVRTVSRRQVAAYIEANIQGRRDHADLETAGILVADTKRTPEQEVIVRQKSDLVKTALNELSQRDREILVRFYLHEQPQEQICREMELTETQFRLTKSRAKAKFGKIGQRKLAAGGVISGLFRPKAA